MKKHFTILFALILVGAASLNVSAQEEIRTLFKGSRTTAYGAISNKFTSIDGNFANMVEVYGGVYLNRRLLIGIGGGGVTNNLPVPLQYNAVEGVPLSYGYVQFGMHTEFVVASNSVFHPVFHLFVGPGLTFQYDRQGWEEIDHHHDDDLQDNSHEENWFTVAEPGIQLELNLLKWMRFSPGISYRFAYGSDVRGLSDSKLSGAAVNLTLKFGKF